MHDFMTFLRNMSVARARSSERMGILMKTRSFAAFVVASMIAICSAQADVHTWDGSDGTLWNTAADWDINEVPSNSDSLTFSGASNQSNTNDVGITSICTLTLSKAGWDINLGAGLVANSAITATGNSVLRCNIRMGLGNTRTITLGGNGNTLTLSDQIELLMVNGIMTLIVNGSGILEWNEPG